MEILNDLQFQKLNFEEFKTL